MRMSYILMIIFSIMLSAHVFADDMSNSKSCGTIAKACKKAGYTKGYNSDKQFWKHCMKPVIMGERINGIHVDAETVKDCRLNKIAELKSELRELESVASK